MQKAAGVCKLLEEQKFPKRKLQITGGKIRKGIRLNLFRDWILGFVLVQVLLHSTDKAEMKITVGSLIRPWNWKSCISYQKGKLGSEV